MSVKKTKTKNNVCDYFLFVYFSSSQEAFLDKILIRWGHQCQIFSACWIKKVRPNLSPMSSWAPKMTGFFQKAFYLALPCSKEEIHRLRYLFIMLSIILVICTSYLLVIDTKESSVVFKIYFSFSWLSKKSQQPRITFSLQIYSICCRNCRAPQILQWSRTFLRSILPALHQKFWFV